MKRKTCKALSAVCLTACLLACLLLTGCDGLSSLMPGSCQGESPAKTGKVSLIPVYLSSSDNMVPLYKLEDAEDENGNAIKVFTDAPALARGTQVFSHNQMLNIGTEEEPDEFLEVQLDGTADPSSAECFYVAPPNITNDISGAVKETSLFVRTSATLYENQEGAEIAGYVKKGTGLSILGFDALDAEGNVNKYLVRSSEEGPEGWVYAKYLAKSEEDALAVYSRIADLHENRIYKGLDLHGGLPSTLDWFPYEKPQFEDNPLCTEAKTMYLCSEAVVNNSGYLQLIKEHGVNAVVIDIKDGQLAYHSEVARELSPTSYQEAYTSVEEYKQAVQAFRDAGVYTIGRIVCFNDSYYAADHPETCIDSPKSTQAWPSAYSRDAWYYNVALAREAVEVMGFNEIQFDYVRFPENAYGMSEDPATDYKNAFDEEKAEAIQNFCFYAADAIHETGAYVSVDVFGECADEYVTAYGQYWPAISNVVDAVSGMPYTDHYGSEKDTWTNPYEIVSTFAKLAAARQSEIDTPAVARTWITGYNTPNWDPVVDYDETKMTEQINALYDAGLTGGFIPWNGGSNIGKYEEYAGIWDKTYTGDPNRAVAEETTTEADSADEPEPEVVAEPEPEVVYDESVYEEP